MRTPSLLLSLVLFGAACSASSGDSQTVASVTEAASASGQYAYAYDRSGLTTSIGNGTTSYALTRAPGSLTAGTDSYRLDAIGRTVAIDDLSVIYGADGQVARASRGVHTTAYVYDENGDRILKTSDGVSTAAYVDGNYVTASELDEPVKVSGKLVGILRNGRFTATATDSRGSVEADANGTSRLGSPFGARTARPDIAAAFDYAEKGYDADLGAVRMGVRDYDPRLNGFLTPDPLFLEHPEKCVTSPVECNLYGYARARPLDFVDPTGKEGTAVYFGAGATLGLGTLAGAGGNISFGRYRGTEGTRWFVSVSALHYVRSVAEANRPAQSILGASGGVGFGVDAVKSGPAYFGEGVQFSGSLPWASANAGVSDDKLNSVGIAGGKGWALESHAMPTMTVSPREFGHAVAGVAVDAFNAVKGWFKK